MRIARAAPPSIPLVARMELGFYTSDNEDEIEKAVPGNWDNVVCDCVSASLISQPNLA